MAAASVLQRDHGAVYARYEAMGEGELRRQLALRGVHSASVQVSQHGG